MHISTHGACRSDANRTDSHRQHSLVHNWFSTLFKTELAPTGTCCNRNVRKMSLNIFTPLKIYTANYTTNQIYLPVENLKAGASPNFDSVTKNKKFITILLTQQ